MTYRAFIFLSLLLMAAACRNEVRQTPASDDSQTAQADSVLLQRAHEARIVGEISAPVRIYEATDFSCPTCRHSYEQKMDSVKAEFVETGEAVLIYLASPLSRLLRSFHGAEAAYCAGGVGGREGFLSMIDQLFRRQEEWRMHADPRDHFVEFAGEAGIDGADFQNCLDRNAVAPLILSDLNMLTGLRVQGLDIPGTPTYIFNERETFYGVQPVSRFREAIETARAAPPP